MNTRLESDAELRAGCTLGPSGGTHPPKTYVLQRWLGKGGSGTVWRAQDQRSGEPVAIKVFPDLALEDERAFREWRGALAQMDVHSRHVVRVLDWGREPWPFIVMELVDGPTLREEISHRGRLTQGDTLRYARGIALALEAIHRAGAVHRDIKPSNVMRDDVQGVVKLTDFGIAKMAEASDLTATGQFQGTPLYTAPEVWKGEAPTYQSDLYSLGCVLFECLAGRAPFVGSPARLFHQHCSVAPDWSLLPRDTVPALSALIAFCLAKESVKRPQGALACLRMVDAAEAEMEAQRRPPAQPRSVAEDSSNAFDQIEPEAEPSTVTAPLTPAPVPVPAVRQAQPDGGRLDTEYHRLDSEYHRPAADVDTTDFRSEGPGKQIRSVSERPDGVQRTRLRRIVLGVLLAAVLSTTAGVSYLLIGGSGSTTGSSAPQRTPVNGRSSAGSPKAGVPVTRTSTRQPGLSTNTPIPTATPTTQPTPPASQLPSLSFDGASLNPPVTLPNLTITDVSGAAFKLQSEAAGHVILLYFGSARCPTVTDTNSGCVETSKELAQVWNQLTAAEKEQVKIIFVDVDPQHDTPEDVASFLAQFPMRPIGLLPDQGALKVLQNDLGLPYPYLGQKVYVFGPDDVSHLAYPPGFTVNQYLHDIRLLIEYGYQRP